MVNETFSALSKIDNLCAIDYDKIEHLFVVYINDDENITTYINALEWLNYVVDDYDIMKYDDKEDKILSACHSTENLRIEIIRLNN